MHIDEQVLYEYLDDELPAGERAEIEAHLPGCATCASKLVAIEELYLTFEQVAEIPLAKDLTPLVMQGIQNRITLAPMVRWATVLQMGAAFLLFVITIPTLMQLPALQTARVALLQFQWDWQPLLNWEPVLNWQPTIDAVRLQITTMLTQITPSRSSLLPFSFFATIPLIVASSLLWVIGNAILLGRTWQGKQTA